MRTLTPRRGRYAAVAAFAGVAALLTAAPALAGPPICPPGGTCDIPGGHPPTIPTITAVTLASGSAQFDWGNDHQQVTVTLTETTVIATGVRTANVRVGTRTWTDNALAGFHATSWADLGPSFVSTSQQRYGVDGTWIGVSDRTDVYDQSVPVSVAEADRGGTVIPHAVHS